MTEPVTTPLRSDSRKTTKSAISSTWPSLPIGSSLAAFSRQSSPAPWKRRWMTSSPSVWVQPMFRPLIRIRSQWWACAALRVRPARPALAATYGARKDWPQCSDEVTMLTTVPGALRATMSATAACMAKKGARRLTAMCASNNSGVVSSSVPREVSPAALTRQSIRPCAATTCSTLPRACAVSARSAGMKAVPASSAASAWPTSGRRPVNATCAPSRTAARTTPAPTPWVPPLTRTTLSFSSATSSPSVPAALRARPQFLAQPLRAPALGHGLPHDVRLRQRGQPTDRRIGVQIGGKGIAFGAGRYHAPQPLLGGPLAAAPQQHREEGVGHRLPVDRLHRAAERGGDLQQVRHAPDVRRPVVPRRVEERGVEEDRIALLQGKLHVVVVEVGGEL